MNELESSAFETSKFFGDKNSFRIIFLRKLYSLLTIQLLYCLIWVSWTILDKTFQNFVLKNRSISLAAIIIQAIILLVVFFGRSMFRKFPVDFLVYFIFTQLLAYNLVYITALTKDPIIIMVISLGSLLTFSLFLYSLTTKFDLTYLGGAIYVSGSALFGFEIFLIASDLEFIKMTYVVLAMITFGFYLIYDTQFIIMGKSLNCEIEDAFVGAVVVYMDVILVFFRVIQLLARLLKNSRH